jgi:folate-binding protein YgfZ
VTVCSDPVNGTFLSFLATRGAVVADGLVRDFGDPSGEIAATASASVVAHLGQFGILAFAGHDARDFLHRQLSCDVAGLAAGASAYGAYCTPKGRMLANFLLWREPDAFHMLLPRSMVQGIGKRLQRYVLRSKVTIAEGTDDRIVMGVSGPQATGAVTAITGTAPKGPMDVTGRDAVTAIGLRGARALITAPTAAGPQVWERLSGALRPVGAQCWNWLEIANGLPWITTATQDEFIPQMANLELIDGVSFRKGCYPGQEIVARAQHLGTVKRRLYLAHLQADGVPAPGQPLYDADRGDQAAGTIVNAAPAPGGGFDVLAVVQTASADGADVRLGSRSGTALEFRTLPYPVS